MNVEEALLKLVPLGKRTIAAFAGDVQLASRCLEFLLENMGAETELDSAIQLMETSLGPFQAERAVELIVAKSCSDGTSDLLHWTSSNGMSADRFDYVQIGSLTSYHSALTPELLSRLVSGGIDVSRMLAIVTAIVQSYGVHDDMIAMNIGGVIFGAQTRLGNVQWHRDTNIVLYDPSFVQHAIISVIARNNAVIVCSSLTNDTRVLAHSASIRVSDIFSEDWLSRAREDLDSGKCAVWVFISTTSRVITIIFRANLEQEGQLVRLRDEGGGKFDLAISEDLMRVLQLPLVDKRDGSLPFRLNVRSD